MASTQRKPPLSNTANRRSQPPVVPSPVGTRPGSRSPAPSAIPAAPNPGMTRRNTIHHRSASSISSPLSARSQVKTRPESTDEAEFENAAILEDLRSRLAKSESAAEAAAGEYLKQIKALQLRLEESVGEQVKMEEAQHSKDEAIEDLEMQIKELTRAKRDQENIYEAERIAAQQEKEELLDREEELNTIIQRLKDSLSQRERSLSNGRRNSYESSIDESVGFAPPGHSPVPSANSLVLQKDKLIESLRLELAESQIRLAEADHHGGTKLQQLESQLLEVRMTNARLMEDNESFQLLLSSAALNGDFPRGDYLTNAFSDTDPDGMVEKVPGSPGNSLSLGSTLAEELEGSEGDEREEGEKIRKLEGEVKQLREQNKAMSLYISGIIERILQHKDSEAILDKTAPLGGEGTDKDLPPPPKEEPSTNIFQRTKSLAMRTVGPQGDSNKPATLQRSQSYRGPSTHKRSQSDASAVHTPNIYRGEGLITPRANTTMFGDGGNYTRSSRVRDSSASVDSGVSDTDTAVGSNPTSPPRHSSSIGPIGGNKLRPLTLAQKHVNTGMMSPPLGGRKFSGDYGNGGHEDGKLERRQSKRTSWIGNIGGLFNRGKDGDSPIGAPGTTRDVVFEGKDVE